MISSVVLYRSAVFILLLVGCCQEVLAQQSVTKQVCLTPFGMNWKTAEEAKTHLVISAKREAVSEIFGEMIRSITQVRDFQLQRDEIEALSVGFIRIQGSPEFRQGTGVGELCTTIHAYVSEEDTQRFRPRTIQKKVCIADPRLSLGEVRKTAEQQARIQAVRDFEPRLQNVQDNIVLSLIHESKTESAGFIPETTTYCVKASGIVYPIELMTAETKPLTSSISDRSAIKINPFNGEWYSPKYRYGFRIEGKIGVATKSNAPTVYKVGDVMLRINDLQDSSFQGLHIYTNGAWNDVTGELTSENTMIMKGGGFTWTMQKQEN
jgi:hypothetical protein